MPENLPAVDSVKKAQKRLSQTKEQGILLKSGVSTDNSNEECE